MGWADKITEVIPAEIILPAMGQGAVGIETRTFDPDVLHAIMALDHEETHFALDAERAFVGELEGGCQVPIGAYATIDDGAENMTLKGLVASLDGETILQSVTQGSVVEAKKLGRELGKEILAMGADKILNEIYQESDPDS
jgi:hydroxymethylbilane synthase